MMSCKEGEGVRHFVAIGLGHQCETEVGGGIKIFIWEFGDIYEQWDKSESVRKITNG